MARGRMVNKKISNSKRVNDLPEPAQLLFTWLIPHLDCNGCFYGSAQMIKSLVLPRKKYSENRIESWLKLMENSLDDEKTPLIVRYLAKGEQYLFMPGFEGEQIGLRRDKEKPEFPTFDGKVTEVRRTDDGLTGIEVEVEVEEKGREEKKATSPEIIKIEFEEYIEELRPQFVDIDFESELKKFHLYWSEGRRKLQRPKSALFNWMLKARDFKKEKETKGKDPDKYTKGKHSHMVARTTEDIKRLRQQPR